MSSTRQSILQSLRDIRLIDPHSHINPLQPASTTLADLLGYHYYTELVHSAGMPKHEVESAGIRPRELVGRLVKGLPHLSNTAQYGWLIDICQRFFGFDDEVIDESNWESLYDTAEARMQGADWADDVLEKSNVEAVFLTNEFDDKLVGFDTKIYIPCLRTDDLVFHLSKVEVRDRLAVCSGIDLMGSLKSLRDTLEQRFEHFVAHGARACAISLPPDFSPTPVSDGRAATALDAILRLGPAADSSHKAAIARRTFWTIVELCDQYRLPMDLMIGVNRGVYEAGVHQGRDLYDSRISLIQYRDLFNAFPDVKFPVSVLASVTNQELVSYAWIFPNVVTHGHWWYSNTPSFIRRDAAARLEAVPRNKQIGYYSDAYKLEFIAPKFDMYRRILAGILTDDFVIERGWSEEQAIELGRQILRGNVDALFPDRSPTSETATDKPDTWLQPSERDYVRPMVATSAFLPPDLLPPPAQLSTDDGNLDFVDEVEASSDPLPTPGRTDPIMSGEALETSEQNDDLPSGDGLSDSTLIEWVPDAESDRQAELGQQPVDEPPGQSDWPLSLDDEPVDSNVDQPIDPHATLEITPEYLEEIQGVEPRSEGIHYFRADDQVPALEVENTDDAVNEETPLGLYADPVTGELTWPTSAFDKAADSEVEEAYLLPDEPSLLDLIDTDSSEAEMVVDFEELEFDPIEEDSELVFSENDIADDDSALLDPEQTLDFDTDEQKRDS